MWKRKSNGIRGQTVPGEPGKGKEDIPHDAHYLSH